MKSHITDITITCKVKDHGDEVCLTSHKSRTKVPEITKLVGRLPMPRKIMHISFNVKRSKVKVTRPITAEMESVSYLPDG